MPGLLLHSPASVFRQLLVDLGYGIDPPSIVAPRTSWQTFETSEPDKPDDAITVYHVTGTTVGRTMPDYEMQEWEGITIRIRCAREEEGTVKARAIAIGLDSVVQQLVTVDSTVYQIWSFNRTSGPIPLGKGTEDSRYGFTINGLSSIKLN